MNDPTASHPAQHIPLISWHYEVLHMEPLYRIRERGWATLISVWRGYDAGHTVMKERLYISCSATKQFQSQQKLLFTGFLQNVLQAIW